MEGAVVLLQGELLEINRVVVGTVHLRNTVLEATAGIDFSQSDHRVQMHHA